MDCCKMFETSRNQQVPENKRLRNPAFLESLEATRKQYTQRDTVHAQ